MYTGPFFLGGNLAIYPDSTLYLESIIPLVTSFKSSSSAAWQELFKEPLDSSFDGLEHPDRKNVNAKAAAPILVFIHFGIILLISNKNAD